MPLLWPTFASLGHYGLDAVKQLFGNQWLVGSFVNLTIKLHESDVEDVFKNALDITRRDRLTFVTRQLLLLAPPSQRVERVTTSRVQLEQLHNLQCLFSIHINAPSPWIIEIPDRCPAWPHTIADFLAQSSLRVLSEVVHEVFALAEGDVEHEQPLGCGLKPEGGELQRLDQATIDQVDDSTTINRITGQTVWVPTHDAVGLTTFDLV